MAEQDVAQVDNADGYVNEIQSLPVGDPPIPQA